jgi:hypothetical protein
VQGGTKYQPKNTPQQANRRKGSKEGHGGNQKQQTQAQQPAAGTPLYKKKEKKDGNANANGNANASNEPSTTLKLPKNPSGDAKKHAASDTTTATPSSNTPTESAPGVKFVRKEKAAAADAAPAPTALA